jgi:hypothetical protein
MSTDDRLKALYRASTRRAADAVPGQDIEQAIGRSGWPDEENTPLDRIAGSALHADILRVVMELGPEAEALSRDVAKLRQPQAAPARRPGAARGWMALAAGMGTAAVLIAGMGSLSRPDQANPLPMGSDVILSASFESGPADTGSALQEPEAIFQGDFDS